MFRIIRLILLLVIGVSGLAFAALNTSQIQVNYYLETWQTPLALAVVLGILLGILTCLGVLIKSSCERTRLHKALKRCEQDRASARSAVLTDVG